VGGSNGSSAGGGGQKVSTCVCHGLSARAWKKRPEETMVYE
jgi:hypothetical protein